MNDKQKVAEHAAGLIESGMSVGLGTGSTANYFIDALARRQRDEGLNFSCVASSVVSAIYAHQAGLDLAGIEQTRKLDVYVDGADEVLVDLSLLKGRGSDLVREKLLATASDEFWVLIDASKVVKRIGQNFPIPIEVMPFAWQMVQESLTKLGGSAVLRRQGDGLHVTSHGSLVLDCQFQTDLDGRQLNSLINEIPGVIEHGVFIDLATRVFCGQNGQVETWRLPG